MTSIPNGLSAHPVRVLIQTRLEDLRTIDPSIEQAEQKVIMQLCIQLSGSVDKAAIRHLITRQSDRNGHTRVDIIFDYNLAENPGQPEVVAFKVRIHDDSLLEAKQLHHPGIKGIVNNTVKIWEEINLKHGLSFPSRPDIRAITRVKRGV
jgi:hypothetical protein